MITACVQWQLILNKINYCVVSKLQSSAINKGVGALGTETRDISRVELGVTDQEAGW
jgi:hypothetical protein